MKTSKNFLDSLYTIKNINRGDGSDKISVRIEINSSHEIFKGHFPGNPVLPGACTVQIIKEIIEVVTGRSLLLSEAGSIKYLSFINPEINKILDTDLFLSEQESCALLCNATVHYEGTTFCSFKGILTASD